MACMVLENGSNKLPIFALALACYVIFQILTSSLWGTFFLSSAWKIWRQISSGEKSSKWNVITFSLLLLLQVIERPSSSSYGLFRREGGGKIPFFRSSRGRGKISLHSKEVSNFFRAHDTDEVVAFKTGWNKGSLPRRSKLIVEILV